MKTQYNSARSTIEAEGSDRGQSTLTRRRRFALALGGFLLTSLFTLPAPLAEAQCSQWNVGHGWRFKQGPTNVDLNLQQKGRVVTGTATHNITTASSDNVMGSFGGVTSVSGTVDGTVEGDSFAVKIYWENNTIGVYNGTIRPSGKIEGTGYKQGSSRTKVNWYSETRMVCAGEAAAEPTKAAPPLMNPPPKPIAKSGKVPANPPPKPISKSGKMPTSQASVPGVPTITAHPTVVTIPEGDSRGPVMLTWDAGPDHPDAEVWMKDTKGQETLVAKLGKGTRRASVERGTNYQIILTDAGEQLARTAVISKR